MDAEIRFVGNRLRGCRGCVWLWVSLEGRDGKDGEVVVAIE